MGRELRIPIAGAKTNRVATANILGAVSSTVGLGVVGSMIVGATPASSSKDQRWINCFAETVSDPLTGKQTVSLVKRPGFTTAFTPAAGAVGSALLVWTGYGTGDSVISAFGSPNSTIYRGTTSLGTITGIATGITETVISGVATLVVTSSDNTAWYYTVALGTMTKITDADFPGNAGRTLAGTFVHLDGYACILDSLGVLWASDLNSLTGWTATSFASADALPDAGVSAFRHRTFVMVFGRESLEFFYNAGLTPFPLAKNVSMTQRVGCCGAAAIGQIADTVFWAGSSPQGGLSIFQYDNGVGRISTPEVDAVLILAGAANIKVTTCRIYGRSFVIVKASTTTFCYCVEEKQWVEWVSSITPWDQMVGVSVGNSMISYGISKSFTTGKVYTITPSSLTFQDDGAPFTATIQLDPIDLNTTERKVWSALTLIGDVQDTSSPVTVSYSDDDYQTVETWGTLDLHTYLPEARRLGSSYRRAWIFTHSANTPMRLQAIALRVAGGNA